MKFYLATTEGNPAGMNEGNQLCFADKFTRCWMAGVYSNLRDLQKDIRKSKKFRKDKGFNVDIGEYDYVVIDVPDEFIRPSKLKSKLTKKCKKKLKT